MNNGGGIGMFEGRQECYACVVRVGFLPLIWHSSLAYIFPL